MTVMTASEFFERGMVENQPYAHPEHTFADSAKEFCSNELKDFFSWLWDGVEAISFWAAMLYGIYNVCCYAATKDNKYSKRIAITIIAYIFIKIIGGFF